MLLCCSFASASLTFRNPSSLSVDRSNSNIYTICRALLPLIATPIRSPAQERFTKKDTGSRLYRTSWICFTVIVTSISCAFNARSSLLQILRNSSPRHSVLILLSLSSMTNLSLLFGFCAAYMLSYRCLQMEWWAAVTIVPSLRSLHCWCACVFQPPDRECSHLGPLALFCTADTLLIAPCLCWLENCLLAYFLPLPSSIVSFASMVSGMWLVYAGVYLYVCIRMYVCICICMYWLMLFLLLHNLKKQSCRFAGSSICLAELRNVSSSFIEALILQSVLSFCFGKQHNLIHHLHLHDLQQW